MEMNKGYILFNSDGKEPVASIIAIQSGYDEPIQISMVGNYFDKAILFVTIVDTLKCFGIPKDVMITIIEKTYENVEKFLMNLEQADGLVNCILNNIEKCSLDEKEQTIRCLKTILGFDITDLF